MMSEVVIEVKNLYKEFKGNQILNDISLTLKKGRIYGIIGYNGSGKTVLFKCLCGFLRPTKGEIIIRGDVLGKKYDFIQDAGVIIEEPAFVRNYSAMKNLEFLYMIRHKMDKHHLEAVLELVGLDSKDKKKVGKFSLGMKQRLAIAQGIMENQSILIFDEPMNGLDKKGVKEIRELLLQKKKEGKTIVMASHNKDDIDILCDEVYELEEGYLKQER